MKRELATCFLIGLTAVGCARRSDRGLGAGADSTGLRSDSTMGRDTTMAPGSTPYGDTAGRGTGTGTTTPGAGATTPGSTGTGGVRSPSSSSSGTGLRSDSTTRHRRSKKDQTQSGVTDKSGSSTLGTGVSRTRPDQNEPVTGKGDTLTDSPGSITDSLNRRQLERIRGRMSDSSSSDAGIQGNDTTSSSRDSAGGYPTTRDSMGGVGQDTTRARQDTSRYGQDTSGRMRQDTTRMGQDTSRMGRDSTLLRSDSTRSSTDSMRPLGTDTTHRWRSDSTPARDSTRRDSVPQ